MPRRTVKEVEASIDHPPEQDIPKKAVLSTGSTELNLACSDSVDVALPVGIMANVIGDSISGKTVLAHSILAESTLNPFFSEYDLVYDNAEAAETEGIERLFGKQLINVLKCPDVGTEGANGRMRSANIHDFEVNIGRALKRERSFLYVLDSLDSIISEEAEQQFDNAVEGKKETGSYGTEKARELSKILGTISRRLESTSSLLLILSQTRDVINPTFKGEKRRAGGRALKFYSSYEMWMALAGKHKKTVGAFEREIGQRTRIKITKNRLTGKVREAEINIFNDYGIDDIGTIIDFLVDGKIWGQNKNTILAKDLNLEGTREKLIHQVEENRLEPQLRQIMGATWASIEEAIKLNRKKKYE